MIKGFDEAMPYLRKGGKGKIYIPSLLGYGAAPPPGGPIKPYDHLIFEVEITDVQAKAPVTK
jgi:FKBP-type peptidyl-prolyl cis-trans isomerase